VEDEGLDCEWSFKQVDGFWGTLMARLCQGWTVSGALSRWMGFRGTLNG
jgi:hypothetical protein